MLDLCAGASEEEDARPCLLVQQTEGISGGGEATGAGFTQRSYEGGGSEGGGAEGAEGSS